MEEGKHRRDYNVWERAGEVQSLRDQLAAAIRVARYHSRQCDALRAALAESTAEIERLEEADHFATKYPDDAA